MSALLAFAIHALAVGAYVTAGCAVEYPQRWGSWMIWFCLALGLALDAVALTLVWPFSGGPL